MPDTTRITFPITPTSKDLSYNRAIVKPFMNPKRLAVTRAFLLLSLAALGTADCLAQTSCSQKRSFSDEDAPCFDNGISVSPAVVAAILKTDKAQDSFPEVEAGNLSRVSKLLRGISVHLRNQRQRDMIVRGDSPMSGGDNTWFWIVTSIDGRPSALWVQCNIVTILRVRHHGYADIRTDWYAGSHRATRIYKNNGRRYKLIRENYVDLPPS
jgi:hypothetical protein